MNHRLIVAFALAFFFTSLCTAAYEGESLLMTTELTQAIDADDLIINVDSTEGFPLQGTLFIGREEVRYDNLNATQFQLTDRGVSDSTATTHDIGGHVYAEDSATLNRMLGFNVSELSSNTGWLYMPMFLFNFVTHSVPNLVLWNFPPLKTGELVLLRYLLMTISTGFVLYVIYQMSAILGGIAQSVISRWRV